MGKDADAMRLTGIVEDGTLLLGNCCARFDYEELAVTSRGVVIVQRNVEVCTLKRRVGRTGEPL